MQQAQLFNAAPALPEGMLYEAGFLSMEEETALLALLQTLPFAGAEYKEWTANRRIVSYGGRYDFNRNVLREAAPIPEFLHPLRGRVCAWSGIPAERINHLLVNEYRPGTQLGWHRDAPDYETVVGVSLGATGRMRLRPYPPQAGHGRAALALDLEPRSIYRLQGPARWDWQHAISPTKGLRYSITFRTLAS
jgi:alkylated DNA repair dioxygenase AlkB